MPSINKEDISKYPIRVIVAGSRNYTDRVEFTRYVSDIIRIHKWEATQILFISGTARGPDSMVIDYCKEFNYDWVEFPAEWKNIKHPNAVIRRTDFGQMYDARAGHNRNIDMAKAATHLIAFWDKKSSGTKHMVGIAAKYHLEVSIIQI